jgi:hypothetical protein
MWESQPGYLEINTQKRSYHINDRVIKTCVTEKTMLSGFSG